MAPRQNTNTPWPQSTTAHRIRLSHKNVTSIASGDACQGASFSQNIESWTPITKERLCPLRERSTQGNSLLQASLPLPPIPHQVVVLGHQVRRALRTAGLSGAVRVPEVFPEGFRVHVVHKEGMLLVQGMLPLRTGGASAQEAVQKTSQLFVDFRSLHREGADH